MASGKSIESRKSTLEKVTKSIDDKQNQLGALEKTKEKVREARGFIDNLSDLDDNVKTELERENDNAYNEISQEGKELSSEMNDDINQLEHIREETNSALDSASEAKKAEQDLINACKENNIIVPETKELDRNIRDNETLLREIIEKQKDADKIASRLGML